MLKQQTTSAYFVTLNNSVINVFSLPCYLQTGTCALFFSAQGGFLEVVKELLEHGAQVDLPSYVSNK